MTFYIQQYPLTYCTYNFGIITLEPRAHDSYDNELYKQTKLKQKMNILLEIRSYSGRKLIMRFL